MNLRAIYPVLRSSSIWLLDFIERLIERGGILNSIEGLVKVWSAIAFVMAKRIYILRGGSGLLSYMIRIEDKPWN